jgi:tetratricopeptide (TPR) repeat protein
MPAGGIPRRLFRTAEAWPAMSFHALNRRSLLVALAFWIVLSGTLLRARPADDFQTAEQLFRRGEFAPAEALFSRIRPGEPTYPQALLRLGTIYYATGRPALAERALTECLRRKESAEAYCLLAGAQFNLKEFVQAHDSARRALRLDPKYAKAYTALGMIYTATNDWPDAQASYQQALRLNPRDADTWFMLGRANFFRDDFARARQAYETALRLDPQQVRVYENLGLTLDLLNDPAAAEKSFQEGARVNQLRKYPDPRLYISYGTFLSKANRADESLMQLREAVGVAPQNPDALFELANQLARMKRWKEAAQEGELAARADSRNPRVHFLLARVYTALGKPDLAAQHAREAARLP